MKWENAYNAPGQGFKINVDSPTRKITWHPCRKTSFKYLFNIYSELKPNVLCERVEKESGCHPTCPSYSSEVQKFRSVLTYTPHSAKQSASGLIRSNLKKRQLVIRYDYSNVPSLGGKRWISPSTQNINVFLLTTYNILQGRTLLTTAFATSLRFQRCFNAPVMFSVAVTGTSRCLGSAPGACPQASEHP